MYEFRQCLPYLLSLVEEESSEKVRQIEAAFTTFCSLGRGFGAPSGRTLRRCAAHQSHLLVRICLHGLPNAHRLRFAGRKVGESIFQEVHQHVTQGVRPLLFFCDVPNVRFFGDEKPLKTREHLLLLLLLERASRAEAHSGSARVDVSLRSIGLVGIPSALSSCMYVAT